MKKLELLFLPFCMAVCLSGCQHDNFRIDGKVPGAAEGDTVFLQQRKGNVLETVDTTLVHDGSFTFTGYNDSIKPSAITYANSNEDYFVPFVIEPGTITIQLKEPFKIGGTTHNERLQQYYTRLFSYQKQLDFFTRKLPPYTYLNKNSALVIAKVKKLNDNCNKLAFNTIRNNLTNPISVILLLRDNYLLNATQIEELTAMLPEQARKLPKIKNLQKSSIEDNYTALGKKFIDFTLPSMSYNASTTNVPQIRLKDVINTHRLTFIDFWASWCVPCCRDLPEIEKLYKKYKKNGLTVIGISLDTDYSEWHKAVYKYGLTYQQLSDLKGFNSQVVKDYYIRAIPRNYLFNQNGTIVGKDIHMEALEKTLRNELSEHLGK